MARYCSLSEVLKYKLSELNPTSHDSEFLSTMCTNSNGHSIMHSEAPALNGVFRQNNARICT